MADQHTLDVREILDAEDPAVLQHLVQKVRRDRGRVLRQAVDLLRRLPALFAGLLRHLAHGMDLHHQRHQLRIRIDVLPRCLGFLLFIGIQVLHLVVAGDQLRIILDVRLELVDLLVIRRLFRVFLAPHLEDDGRELFLQTAMELKIPLVLLQGVIQEVHLADALPGLPEKGLLIGLRRAFPLVRPEDGLPVPAMAHDDALGIEHRHLQDKVLDRDGILLLLPGLLLSRREHIADHLEESRPVRRSSK